VVELGNVGARRRAHHREGDRARDRHHDQVVAVESLQQIHLPLISRHPFTGSAAVLLLSRLAHRARLVIARQTFVRRCHPHAI